MEKQKMYQTPNTTVYAVRLLTTALLTSSTENVSSASFEDLTEGGDFAW